MTKLVGILNVTPDSFSDGGLFLEPKKAIKQAEQMFKEGAEIVDVGAESTRPGATPLTSSEEWKRLEPVLTVLLTRFPGKISVDTYHPETAERALSLGDVMINDVTAMNNPKMVEIIASHRANCIVSYLTGTNIQAAHTGELLEEVDPIKQGLLSKAHKLEELGIKREQIILDPGIGFGKTPELNRHLLEFAREIPNYKVMIGYSRKRFLGENRLDLEPNLEAGKVAIEAGAAYIRVHDVAGHRQLL